LTTSLTTLWPKLAHSLDRKLQLLATQPMMGRARDELVHGLRSRPFGRYVIFYELLKDGIVVVRVLHGARDLDAQFGGAQTEE